MYYPLKPRCSYFGWQIVPNSYCKGTEAERIKLLSNYGYLSSLMVTVVRGFRKGR